ncbi:MAG: RNA 2',3'-cyclic phosphodiesterase [Planctomycetaceae bacterium]
MHTIRSFIAIPLSGEVQRAARKLARELHGEKDGMKWVPEDNLHLTLKFLGDVVDRDVPQVCKVIRECCQPIPPFELEFEGTGGFPSDERPRVIWAGICSGGEYLVELVSRLEKELAKLGFKPEPRDYRPHLTLGRVRSGSRAASPEVVAKVARFKRRRLGTMPVEQVRLYSSYLDKSGPSYHVMDTVYLGGEPDSVDDDFADDEEWNDDDSE